MNNKTDPYHMQVYKRWKEYIVKSILLYFVFRIHLVISIGDVTDFQSNRVGKKPTLVSQLLYISYFKTTILFTI